MEPATDGGAGFSPPGARIYPCLTPRTYVITWMRLRPGCGPAAWTRRPSCRSWAKLEAERRRLIPEVESLKAAQNAAGAEVARAKREGRDPSGIFAENKARGGADQGPRGGAGRRSKGGATHCFSACRTCRTRACPSVPPRPTTPKCDGGVRRRPSTSTPKPHWDLGPALGILDFERATRMSGARFSVLLGAGREARTRAHQLHARPAHARARLPGSRAAVSGRARPR